MKLICSLFLENDPVFFQNLQSCTQSSCSMIEIRLDRYYPKNSLIQTNQLIKQVMKTVTKPVIWTMRTDQDPESCSKENYNYLLRLLNKDKLLFDLEIQRIQDLNFEPDFSRVVLSYHNFKTVPDSQTLQSLLQKMNQFNPWILKLALTPESVDQLIEFVSCMQQFSTRSEKITVGMGELGLITRVAPELFGFSYSFCAFEELTAKGQLDYEQMIRFQKILKLA